MGKRPVFSIYMIVAMMGWSGLVWGAGKDYTVKANDLNYRYQVNYSGWVIDFTDPAVNLNELKTAPKETEHKIPRKVLVELMIESIRGGFDWLPMNPVVSNGASQIYPDCKVVIAPQSGDSIISIKYLITGVTPGTDSLMFFEEGLSPDGKKAYRLYLKRIPL